MSELSRDLGFLLARSSGLVARAANDALADYGLRVRPYAALSAADEAPQGLSQRQLAALLGLDPSQIVALVDDLVELRLVERLPSPHDRRARLIAPTTKGKEIIRAARRSVDLAVRHRMSNLSRDEQETLTSLLARVVVENRVSPRADTP